MPFWFWALVVFVYGTVVGSFLNVCICRMPKDESIIKPPSHCPKCGTQLRVLDLVPLISFLALGRKCRYCGEPIGWRYFLVELATGVLSVALFWKYVGIEGSLPDFLAFALFSAALIAVFFIDLEHWIIPDQLSVFGIVLGVLRDVYGAAVGDPAHSLYRIPIPMTGFELPMLRSIVGLIVCGGLFYLIAVLGEAAFKKEAMGGGDIKLAAAVGTVLPLPLALLSFFVAVFVGSVIGIGGKIADRKKRKEQDEEYLGYLPFGPMMVIGVIVVLFIGQTMINAYLKYLRIGGL